MMQSFVRNHRFVIASIVLSLFLCSALIAEPARPEQVRTVANTFLKMRTAQSATGPRLFSVTTETMPTGFQEIRDDDGAVLAYIVRLEPRGFIAISTDTDIHPIIAYSLHSSFPSEDDEKNPLYRLLKEDMRFRLEKLAENGPSRTKKNSRQWNLYGGGMMDKPASEIFQQWPAENTTATGGWLETTWHQSEPYNDLCPLDPVDGRRCVVGCVAAAMAQLINYHQLCNVTFDESDTYSTYNGIDIDADSAYGGGIYNFFGVPSIINNTIAHNRPNGLDLDWVTDWFVEEPALVWNNIVWENEMYVWDEVYPDEYDLRYNDIQGGPKGEEEEGNIDVDPHFADPQNRDYHLKSEAGRWDPVTESWITDGVTSPCIDAGHPETEIGQESAPHGSRVNMGAYGGTGQASKSLE